MKKRHQKFERKTRNKVWEKTMGHCWYCGEVLRSQDLLDEGGKVAMTVSLWHIDHVKPVSKGGGDEIGNLVPSCIKCNLQKGAKYDG